VLSLKLQSQVKRREFISLGPASWMARGQIGISCSGGSAAQMRTCANPRSSPQGGRRGKASKGEREAVTEQEQELPPQKHQLRKLRRCDRRALSCLQTAISFLAFSARPSVTFFASCSRSSHTSCNQSTIFASSQPSNCRHARQPTASQLQSSTASCRSQRTAPHRGWKPSGNFQHSTSPRAAAGRNQAAVFAGSATAMRAADTTHHKVAHELDRRVDVCFLQLLRRLGPHAGDICQFCDILQRGALEVCVLLGCRDGHGALCARRAPCQRCGTGCAGAGRHTQKRGAGRWPRHTASAIPLPARLTSSQPQTPPLQPPNPPSDLLITQDARH